MPRNIELKLRIASATGLAPKVAVMATAGPSELFQDDTFFACSQGRLKLRAFSSTAGELIFYRRPDQPGPKESFYVLSPVAEPDSLRETLTLAYGVTGRVVKQRTLFLVGRTRVHLDRVHGLGDFLELEVVLAEGEPPQQGEREARELLAQLGLEHAPQIAGAYVDLLAAQCS